MYKGNIYEYIEKLDEWLKENYNLTTMIYKFENVSKESYLYIVVRAMFRSVSYGKTVYDTADLEEQIIDYVKQAMKNEGLI